MKKFKKVTAIILTLIVTMSWGIFPVAAYPSNELNDDEVAEGYYYSEILEDPYHAEDVYIDFYDLNIVDVFESFDSYLDFLFLEDDYLFEAFQNAQHLMNVQADAVAAYSLLMEDFLREVDGNLDFVYPDDYAGAYVDYDTLVIQLTDISDESTAFYRALVGSDAPIRFKQVNFSLNQLIAFGEVFVYAIDAPIVSFGFDTMNNVYSIVLDQSSSDSVQMVESLQGTLRFLPIPISLELSEPVEFQANPMWGGTTLTNSAGSLSSGVTGTAGVMEPVLLTSGHVFGGLSAGAIVRRNNQEIGRLVTYRAGTGSVGSPGTTHGDWGIVRLNSTGFITNEMRCRGRINSAFSTGGPPVGSTINGTGALTHWTATVSAVNQSVQHSEPGLSLGLVTGLTRTVINGTSPQNGDSGSPIWQRSGNTTTFAGVHAARRGRLWGLLGEYGYFSPFSWARPHISPWMSNNNPG
ncbi:MAG: S1 family peptidase [Defluviitaleaceae bacterium]|nr:S1 family peptidase [Defluviitaleaceae bacterium]